ncbi:MAG: hypothetical protein JWM38_1805, partial [Sphingomonas bacterium]|nr:hypothetical protein [Sphingomonas bacterium]
MIALRFGGAGLIALALAGCAPQLVPHHVEEAAPAPAR